MKRRGCYIKNCITMRKKKERTIKKVQIVLEVEERPTKCCECVFGGKCPYACAFAGKLDCAKYDLGSVVLKEIRNL